MEFPINYLFLILMSCNKVGFVHYVQNATHFNTMILKGSSACVVYTSK